MTDDIRPTWALFDGDGEHYGKGVYFVESDADNALWGLSEDIQVEPACQCNGVVWPATNCSVCAKLEEYGFDE
jgi:hypothetical protein